MDKYCGQCKHWHEWENQAYRLKQGNCDKVPKGTPFDSDLGTYHFDGITFEDEVYDDCFNCFEER